MEVSSEYSEMSAEGDGGGSRGRHNCPHMEHPTVLPTCAVDECGDTQSPATTEGSSQVTPFQSDTPTTSQTSFDGLSYIWDSLQAQGVPTEARDVMLESWRSLTKKQYGVYIKKWVLFCSERNFNPVQSSVSEVLQFLTELYNSGIGYSALNTARCALSCMLTLNGYSAGAHPLVVRYMKGVFQCRPTQSRYSKVWDVNIVLCFLRQWKDNDELSLKHLTLKLVTLIALVTAQRAQTIYLLDLENMIEQDQCIVFKLGLLKQSKPGVSSFLLDLHAYPTDIKVCVLNALRCYLTRTKQLRGAHTKVFISYMKPHNPVNKSTVSRWIKTMLALAGIDTSMFSAHSTRTASASKASSTSLPVSDIMATAGWSTEKTFAKHYNVPITETMVPSAKFANTILQ